MVALLPWALPLVFVRWYCPQTLVLLIPFQTQAVIIQALSLPTWKHQPYFVINIQSINSGVDPAVIYHHWALWAAGSPISHFWLFSSSFTIFLSMMISDGKPLLSYSSLTPPCCFVLGLRSVFCSSSRMLSLLYVWLFYFSPNCLKLFPVVVIHHWPSFASNPVKVVKRHQANMKHQWTIFWRALINTKQYKSLPNRALLRKFYFRSLRDITTPLLQTRGRPTQKEWYPHLGSVYDPSSYIAIQENILNIEYPIHGQDLDHLPSLWMKPFCYLPILLSSILSGSYLSGKPPSRAQNVGVSKTCG